MTAVACFVKTPGLSPIKTRLASRIGKEKAEAFYRLSCQWTSELLSQLKSTLSAEVFWAVAEEEGMSSDDWKLFPRVYQQQGDLGERLFHVYESLLKRFGSVIVLGADSPELSLDVLVEAVRELQRSGGSPYVMGKTVDGGFYLLGGKEPIDKDLWTSVSYSQSTTAESIQEKLLKLGTIKQLPLCADVDVFEDIEAVIHRCKKSHPEKYSALLALKLI